MEAALRLTHKQQLPSIMQSSGDGKRPFVALSVCAPARALSPAAPLDGTLPLSPAPVAIKNNTVADGAGAGARSAAVGPGTLFDTGLLRQAVAVALVAAKRRRLQEAEIRASGCGVVLASDSTAEVERWRLRTKHLEAEVQHLRGAAAALSTAVGLSAPTFPPPSAADALRGPVARSALQALLLPLLLPVTGVGSGSDRDGGGTYTELLHVRD